MSGAPFHSIESEKAQVRAIAWLEGSPSSGMRLQKYGNWRVFQIMAPMLHDWDNFYVTTGAASASLLGLLFVVVTLGAGFSSSDAIIGARAFLTPTLVHFGSVLLLSLAVLAPSVSPWPTAVILCLCGLSGLAYLTKIIAARRKVDFVALSWADWIPYGGVPALANACLIVGAAGLTAEKSFAPSVIAGAAALFLICGVYGAWDLTLWIIVNGRKR
jgi:hypothetical protein